MTIYDPACGSGGMLTESQNFIEEKSPDSRTQRDIHLYGKEINDETYAICKSDMMITGNNPAHRLDARYFEYQYRTPGFIQQRDRFSKGITDLRKRLYWDGFKQRVTLVPPIEGQRAIIEFIEQATLKQNAAVALLQQQITKLKEYKAALINSAVTGKIKVPGVVEPGIADMEVA